MNVNNRLTEIHKIIPDYVQDDYDVNVVEILRHTFHQFTNGIGENISHISYHEPHPLEKKIIVRIVLNKSIEPITFEEYKNMTNKIMIDNLTILYEYLEDCLNNWKEVNANDIYKKNLLI